MPTLPVVSTLMDAVMNELRIPVTNLTERTKIQSVMSYVYGDICAKQDWWWLVKKYASIVHRPRTNEDDPLITATVTQYSDVVTLSSAPTTTTLVQRAVWFPSAGDTRAVYRTTSTNAFGATSIRLDGFYAGVSASGTEMVVADDRVLIIPNTMAKMLRLTHYGGYGDLAKIGIEEMSRLKQQDRSFGPPVAWSIFDADESGDYSTNRTVWVHPYPDQDYRVELWYKHQQAGDLSDVSIPVDYQQTLVYGTLARAYTIFLNDTERGSFFTSLFNDVMALMAAQQREYASDHPGVNPQPSAYRRTNRRFPVATSLGRYFDTYPYNP